MKFEHTEVFNIDGAIRGMRNPMDSWGESDSGMGCRDDYYAENKLCRDCGNYGKYCSGSNHYILGPRDLKLAQKLIRAGSEHRKFMRQIFVCVDITAPLYWWSEYDTYKVATTANSCSTMHKLHAYPMHINMFAVDTDNWDAEDICFWQYCIAYLESKRSKYNQLKDANDPKAIQEFRKLKQALNCGFMQKRTLTFSYETLLAICSPSQRRNHRLSEWSEELMDWARSLPYANELIFIDKYDKEHTCQH